VNESTEGVGYSKEKAVTALAEFFSAAFSSAVRESCQCEATVTCARIERTSLIDALTGSEEPLSAVGVQFLEGLRGNGLVLLRQEDMKALAAHLLPEQTETDGDVQAAWQAWESLFARTLEVLGAKVGAEDGMEVKSEAPTLLAGDANPDTLSEVMGSLKNVVSMTFEFAVESVLEGKIWLLAHPDIPTSLETLLAIAQSPPEIPADDAADSKWNMDLILDVELGVTVAFGESEMPLKDVLKLGVGSVVELEKGVNDPVTIIVNEKPIARGEVVMVDGNYGVRILEVESTADRIRSLG
jgi:flagellar motor switch protein FliN